MPEITKNIAWQLTFFNHYCNPNLASIILLRSFVSIITIVCFISSRNWKLLFSIVFEEFHYYSFTIIIIKKFLFSVISVLLLSFILFDSLFLSQFDLYILNKRVWKVNNKQSKIILFINHSS